MKSIFETDFAEIYFIFFVIIMIFVVIFLFSYSSTNRTFEITTKGGEVFNNCSISIKPYSDPVYVCSNLIIYTSNIKYVRKIK